MEDKLPIIRDQIEKGKQNYFSEHKYLTSAILNTIEIEKLIKLYSETEELDLKRVLDYHLNRRLTELTLDQDKIFKLLLRGLKSKKYSEHQRNRTLLTYLVNNLSIKYIRQYYKILFNSKYQSDVNAALKVADKVWRPGWEAIYIDKFIDTLDETFLKIAIDKGDTSLITKRLEEIWECDGLNNYVKNLIIKKVSPSDFAAFEFLKEKEPDKYLYACAFAGHKLNDTEINLIYDKLSQEQKVFGLWCIGKMQNWEFIKKELHSFK